METLLPVLVVDDEPAIRALVAKIVERAGLRVDTASDGLEAMSMLAKRRYAVLVLDLNMPHMNGIDVIESLKRYTPPKPAIIVISASDSVILRQLDGSMVHSIVRKPFDIDVLGDLVAAAARTIAAADTQGAAGGEVLPFPSAS
ncbi:MAG: response regulator [Thermoanaerobaculia bacterium]